ncbi:MAG: hypothetical protein LC789_03330 [Actinobacteria bacterium]|nr:hypothetical protein [Actinomycetota bacterium]MCA1721949.1 hypothetical protein [Actinomycetota bacterium]
MDLLPPRSFASRALVLALVTAAAVPAAAAPSTSGQCALVAEPVVPADAPTLYVTLRAEKRSYRRGQTALLPIEVRVGAPAGPAVAGADVEVIIATSGGRVVRTIGAMTSGNGTTRARLRITSAIPEGDLTATATARSVLVPGSDCTPGLVYQVGQATADPLTRVSG